MVNTGKPSTSCRSCRVRRIKAFVFVFWSMETSLTASQCDERRPTCHKCEVSRRECHGYRDQNELRFRSRGLRTQHHEIGPKQPHLVPIQPARYVPPPSLNTNLDDVVLSSYMCNFVNAKARGRELGIIDPAVGPLLDVMGPIQARCLSTGPSFSAILAMAWASTVPFAGPQYSMQ